MFVHLSIAPRIKMPGRRSRAGKKNTRSCVKFSIALGEVSRSTNPTTRPFVVGEWGFAPSDDPRYEHVEVAVKDALAAARRQVDDLAPKS